MPNLHKDLFTPAYHLDQGRRKRLVRWLIWASLAVATVVLPALIVVALQKPDPDNPNPAWDAINACRAALIRLAIAGITILLALGAWVYTFQVMTHTEIGRRWLIWDKDDSEPVKAQKTRNAGTLLAILGLAFILGLLVAVPR